MELISNLNLIGTPSVGELIAMPREQGILIGVMVGSDPGRMIRLVVLSAPSARDVFTQKLVKPEKYWGSYGARWILDVEADPRVTTHRMGRVAEHPGVVTVSERGAQLALALGGDQDLVLHLDDWAVDAAFDYDGLIYPKWRIWASPEHRRADPAQPLIEWSVPDLASLIAG